MTPTETEKLVADWGDGLYAAIAHGDETHRKWLRDKMDEYYVAHPQLATALSDQAKEIERFSEIAAKYRYADVADMLILCGEPEAVDGKDHAEKLRALIDGLITERKRATQMAKEIERLTGERDAARGWHNAAETHNASLIDRITQAESAAQELRTALRDARHLVSTLGAGAMLTGSKLGNTAAAICDRIDALLASRHPSSTGEGI